MKKMITAFALAMVVLAGCGAPENSKEGFTADLGKTEDNKVRVYAADLEDLTSYIADANLATLAENGLEGFKEEVTTVLEGLTLTEDANQEKVYGNPVFFIDLNNVMDDNYQRFIVYENIIVIADKDSFKNYTLDDASKEALFTLYDKVVA